jgi:hypothetical protein
MKILPLIMILFVLCGCETIGDMVREKKYSLQIHETPYSVQTFGYNTDHDYIGFMMHGRFGKAPPKHVHSLHCKHNIENKSKKTTILR